MSRTDDVVEARNQAPGPEAPGLPPVASGSSVSRGVLVSAGTQLAAKVLHLVLNVVSSLAVVRYLAPETYGVYAIVLTVTALVTLAADFGLPKLAVREICAAAGDGAAEDRVLGTVVGLRLGLALAGAGVMQVLLVALGQPSAAHPAAAIASLILIGEAVAGAVVVVFQVRLAQHYEALVRTAAEIVETTAILLLIGAQVSMSWLFVPPAAGAALSSIAVLAIARRRFGRRLRFDRRLARRLLAAAAPMAPALLVGELYRKVDSLALAALRPPEDVGIYAAAVQPVEYAFLSTALLMNVAFPLMSAAFSSGDTARFRRLYRRGAESLVLLTAMLPVILLFVARPLAVLIYGPAYAPADVPLVLHAIAVVPLAVCVWQSLALLVGGHQRATLRYNLATLAVATVSSGVLVAAFGVVGAGVAAVGTALYAVVASDRAVRRLMGVGLQFRPFLPVLGTAALMTGALGVLALVGVPWPWQAVAGVTVFVVAARCTGAHRSLLGVLA